MFVIECLYTFVICLPHPALGLMFDSCLYVTSFWLRYWLLSFNRICDFKKNPTFEGMSTRPKMSRCHTLRLASWVGAFDKFVCLSVVLCLPRSAFVVIESSPCFMFATLGAWFDVRIVFVRDLIPTTHSTGSATSRTRLSSEPQYDRNLRMSQRRTFRACHSESLLFLYPTLNSCFSGSLVLLFSTSPCLSFLDFGFLRIFLPPPHIIHPTLSTAIESRLRPDSAATHRNKVDWPYHTLYPKHKK